MRSVVLRLGTRSVQARLDTGGEVLIDDSAFAITALAPGVYVVDDGMRRWHVAVAGSGDSRWVSVNGEVFVLTVAPPAARVSRRRDGDSMTAPMPATVVQVLVEPGQSVTEGDVILVLEAMKMELPIRASRSGVVAAVRCTAGALVQPGMPLVDLR